LRAGNAVAVFPAGENLYVQVIESPKTRLLRLPLHGGEEREVPVDPAFRLSTNLIGPNAVGKDGRMLAPMASPDSWSSPPCLIDLATGRVQRIPVEGFDLRTTDHGWGRAGEVVAAAFDGGRRCGSSAEEAVRSILPQQCCRVNAARAFL
jgi:hypothetical protein